MLDRFDLCIKYVNPIKLRLGIIHNTILFSFVSNHYCPGVLPPTIFGGPSPDLCCVRHFNPEPIKSLIGSNSGLSVVEVISKVLYQTTMVYNQES